MLLVQVKACFGKIQQLFSTGMKHIQWNVQSFKKILAEAMKMLAAGGNLVYSTCTWAPEENEAVIRWLLSQYDYLELVNVPKLNGMVQGIDMPQVARMYPHLFKGEGQFIAKLRDRRIV